MREWKFWDWIGFGSLGLSAFGIALREASAGRELAMLGPLADSILAFAPLTLFVIGTVILILRAFGYLGPIKGRPQAAWAKNYQPRVVVGQTFTNEKVPLDGHRYVKCTFTNVTFEYNGTTAIQFEHNTIHGPPRFSTSAESIATTLVWFYMLGLLSESVHFEGKALAGIEKAERL